MSRVINAPTPAPQDFIGVAAVNKGGTGSTDTVTAITTLGGIDKTKLGQPGYVAKLSSGGQIDPTTLPTSVVNTVTLKGPKSLYLSQTATYTITNYDGKTTYAASVSAGSVSVSGNVVTVNAPATVQTINLTVAGRVIPIAVTVARPVTPTISVTTAGSGAGATATITGSVFAMQSGSVAQLSADWEIYSDVALTKIISSSLDDKTNLASWLANTLALSTTYYARARYGDANGNKSDWSTGVSFTTKATYVIGAEEAKLLVSDPAASDAFGWAVSLSSDGSRVIVGANTKTGTAGTLQGAVYVFLRTGSSWTQEAKLLASDPSTSDYFGQSVSISADGTRTVIGAYNKTGSAGSGQGAVYVFLRTGTSWVQEAKLVASDAAASDRFGYAVSISPDGSRVAIGAPVKTVTATNQGVVYVFLRTGTVWAQEARVVASDAAASEQLGFVVSMNNDGSRFSTGVPYKTGTAGTNQGAAYVFLRTETSWVQEAKLLAGDPASGDLFGFSTSITTDGLRVIIGALAKTGTFGTQGAAYVFLRTGTSWAQEAKLLVSDPAATDRLGVSVGISSDGTRVIVGAQLKVGTAGSQQGAAYTFTRSGVTWAQERKILASDPGASDNFGWSSTITSDNSRIAIGVYNKPGSAGSQQGAVYIEA